MNSSMFSPLGVSAPQKVDLGDGTYGSELESILRRQGRAEKDYARRRNLEIPSTNRISMAASGGRFGNIRGDGTDEIAVALADFLALDSLMYKQFRRGGGKLQTPTKGPRAIAAFFSSGKRKIRLYFILRGKGRESERKSELKRLRRFREEKHELSASHC